VVSLGIYRLFPLNYMLAKRIMHIPVGFLLTIC
jgi:hypothetical protein